MSVSLKWLLEGIATLPADAEAALYARVEDLTLDSRAVRAHSLFFALRGGKSHGLEYAAEATARGASVLLWDAEESPDEELRRSVAALIADNSVFAAPVAGLKSLMGKIADRFFGSPSATLRIVGITGTNGKTTCAYLLAQSLTRLGCDAAYIGTIGWGRIGALELPTHTTPDVVTLHRQLAALRAAGVRDVVMEVSSHALDQGRIDGVRFAGAAFTNLTRDHLDYHLSMEAYGAAKARLFAAEGVRHLVVNIGDAFWCDRALRYDGPAALTAVWVGAASPGEPAPRRQELFGKDIALGLRGLSMSVGGSFGETRLHTHLIGSFNADNAVLVLGCLTALGVTLDAAASALAAAGAPPGRMELVESSDTRKPLAVIDYAHTPDALAKALRAVREHCRGELWCVFGCGGDRDAGKRPIMGAIADTLADRIIVTDDNPRSEDPERITQHIVSGIRRHGPEVIHDRGQAIATALNRARAEDLVLIAGKGHEAYQIYGDTRRAFSDRDQAQRCLEAAA